MQYDCLIIDDEKLLADSTAEYFNLFGVNTAVAYSAAQCRKFFETDSAQLLLLDINLGVRQRLCPVQRAPGKDGDSHPLHLRPEQR